MQGDMTWVREDLGVVHEVMEKIAEHMSMMGQNPNDGEGAMEQGPGEESPWGAWRELATNKEDGKTLPLHPRGGYSIVKENTTCETKKSIISKLHHKNGSKFYQFFFMSRYTQYLLHTKNS